MSLYFKNKWLTCLENHVLRLIVRDSVYSQKGHLLGEDCIFTPGWCAELQRVWGLNGAYCRAAPWSAILSPLIPRTSRHYCAMLHSKHL